MAMMKAGLAGVAIGALALATVMFVPPIAAQGPGGPPAAPRGGEGPGMRGPGTGPGMMGQDRMGPGMGQDRMGPGMMGRERGSPLGRRDLDPADPDITGPRGDAGICQERLTRMARVRLERIERLVRPTDAQRAAFDELRTASAKALDIARAACPAEMPLTPTGRMELAEKRMEARLQALKILRPPLEAFYKLLSDEQKIRWSLGDRGAWRERWDDEAWHRRGEGRWQERGATGRDWRDDRAREEREEREGRGAEPRRRDQERWGERWRDLDRPDPRWRNEYPGRPEERL
jgi:hypothetical protein